MIPPGEIFRMAHRLSLGDKTIEQNYVLTWTLLAICLGIVLVSACAQA